MRFYTKPDNAHQLCCDNHSNGHMNTFNISRLGLPAIVSLTLLLAACGGGGSGGNQEAAADGQNVMVSELDSTPIAEQENAFDGNITECSIADQNQRVNANMMDYYLFYDQVPTVNLEDYDAPETLIRDLRVLPFDRFSFVTDAAQAIETVEAGRNYGAGFNLRFDAAGNARVIFVDPNGPAAAAGFKRGDIIVSIGGIAVDELTASTFEELLGPRENPNQVAWEIIDGASGDAFTLTLAATEHDLSTVVFLDSFTHPQYDGEIGYLVFTQFIETSDVELDRAFQDLADRGVTDLIVDLRYNPGGRTRIARKLASLISSPATDGELLIQYRLNDRYEEFNFERIFEPEENALGLESVVFITTGSTASSSEIVINSLRPYIDVRLVGGTTTGKPYISSPRDFCGKRMNALEGEGFNANNQSVFGGIPADCQAADDISVDFGLNNGELEPMLLAAADSIVFGTCEIPIVASASEEATRAANKQTELSYQPPYTAEELFDF